MTSRSGSSRIRQGISFHDGTPVDASTPCCSASRRQKADPLVGLAVKPFYPETGATERIDDLTRRSSTCSSPTPTSRCTSPASSATCRRRPGSLQRSPTRRSTSSPSDPDRSCSTAARPTRSPASCATRTGGTATSTSTPSSSFPCPTPTPAPSCSCRATSTPCRRPIPAPIQTLDDDPSIQQIKDETGEESFVMINTRHGTVRRHPGP